MGYFAHLDENDVVTNIIIVEKEDIESGLFGNSEFWIETDIHTRYNIHYGENNEPDDGTPLRGNYAVIGGKYDRVNDVFYPIQPYTSWTISAPDWKWIPPTPKPPRSETHANIWNEETLSWEQVPR
jgi:hypothetical protein